MTDKPQWQLVLDLFHANDGVLTTSHFGSHPVLWAEYRRALCDLKKHGFVYVAKPLTKKLWEYRLIPSQPSLLEEVA